MKKRIIAFAAILALAVSMTGCGKKAEKKSNITDSNAVTDTASQNSAESGATAEAKTEEQIKEELDNFAKDADKNADLSKIEGTQLKGDAAAKGSLNGCEVEIDKAVKTQSADGSSVIVVEYIFKNKTSETTKFDSVVKATAVQNGQPLPVAVTYEAEGYDILTVAQDVKSGDKIKVQKAFKLISDTDAVEATVSSTDTASGAEPVVKTFSLQ